MIKVNKITIIGLFFVFEILSINYVFSQDKTTEPQPAIVVKAVATKNTIMLRWGVTTPVAWKYANEYGYIIERKTIVKGKKIATTVVKKRLTEFPIKPKPMAEWEDFTKTNDYAAIEAQAIYGEGFDVNMGEDKGPLSMINQAEELEQRFSFALYAANQDFEVAKFAGLAYIDNDVKEGERYLYTVKSAIPENIYKVESGVAFLGLSDYRTLPKPQEFVGVFKDKTVTLSWNSKMLEDIYSSYVIERSDDNGITFNVITDPPLASLQDKKETLLVGRMMYLDTFPNNSQAFQYRVSGISFFGKRGPHSKIVSGKGKERLKYTPYISETKLNKDQTNLLITWEFPQEGKNALDFFKILKSSHLKGVYTEVKTKIPKTQSSLTISSNIEPVNYYKIIAVGKDGSETESFPRMVQIDDSTPPETPSLLSGKIDSTGIVRLTWKQNTEIDFLGYRVFKANLKNDEFTQITFRAIPNSRIIDTVNLKSLNNKVYYKVQAFDKRLNPSGFSEVLELKKPDVVPPSQPVFSSFKVDQGKVMLTWITSTSNDAVKTMIYKKEKGKKTPWALVAEVPLPDNKYVDENTVPLSDYLYTLLTVDESGLESEPIAPLSISISDYKQKPEIEYFKGVIDRDEKNIQLKWKYNQPHVSEILLYKGKDDAPPTLYKIFEPNVREFTDIELKINSKYKYLLQVVFVSGTKTAIKKLELKY